MKFKICLVQEPVTAVSMGPKWYYFELYLLCQQKNFGISAIFPILLLSLLLQFKVNIIGIRKLVYLLFTAADERVASSQTIFTCACFILCFNVTICIQKFSSVFFQYLFDCTHTAHILNKHKVSHTLFGEHIFAGDSPTLLLNFDYMGGKPVKLCTPNSHASHINLTYPFYLIF